jgi:hypothetical protein
MQGFELRKETGWRVALELGKLERWLSPDLIVRH